MQYRPFGTTGAQVSALGFGMMRLPVHDNDPAKIDEEKTAEMVQYAIEHGVNYFDTAYPYHREQSEVVVGKLLKGENRKKVYIATKCPTWLVTSRSDYDRFLDIQLERLQTDHVDMYLMHGINRERWKVMRETGFDEFLDAAKKDGRITYAGFSFHDDLDMFKEAVDGYPWHHCQIQYNYMDENYQAGTEGLRYAHSKGLAVIIMEPLRGGRLAQRGPEEVGRIWDSAPVKRTPAEWGLRWVWNHPEVSVVLSGMSEMSQLVENINTVETALPGSLTQEELKVIERVRDTYLGRVKVGCTGCEYCMPCPQGINIPEWFDAYNRASIYDTLKDLPGKYEDYKARLGDLEACVSCGLCEDQCPQNLTIRQYLRDIRTAALGPKETP